MNPRRVAGARAVGDAAEAAVGGPGEHHVVVDERCLPRAQMGVARELPREEIDAP
jgi:hypothetical protein